MATKLIISSVFVCPAWLIGRLNNYNGQYTQLSYCMIAEDKCCYITFSLQISAGELLTHTHARVPISAQKHPWADTVYNSSHVQKAAGTLLTASGYVACVRARGREIHPLLFSERYYCFEHTIQTETSPLIVTSNFRREVFPRAHIKKHTRLITERFIMRKK